MPYVFDVADIGFPAMPGGTDDCRLCHGNDSWREPLPRSQPDALTPSRTWRARCGSCHDSAVAQAHFDLTRARQSPARQLSRVTEVHGLSHKDTPVPDYLARTYWWAYMHPRSVYVFERQWLVNLILWGNFPRLRDAALDTLGQRLDGNTLQIACVYGNLTARLFSRLVKNARLDVVDILPIQLENLARKLPPGCGVRHIHGNSAALDLESASYDRALLFFLLHEQPEDVRRDTLAEAFRVVRPGGQLVIVDYHRPHRVNPLYLPMMAMLTALEPFALDLWRHDVARWFPAEQRVSAIEKSTTFGGLYQVLKVTV